MQSSNAPTKIQLPFAATGTKNTIPVPSQQGITPGAASYTEGFPPLTFTPLSAGGVPPAGADFNGIFNALSAIQQWQSAGGLFKYDAAFSTAIGGYPAGAVLLNAFATGLWISTSVNNYTVALSPAPVHLTPGMVIGVGNFPATNTGASSITVNGLGIIPIAGNAGNNLQGGELVAGYGEIGRASCRE